MATPNYSTRRAQELAQKPKIVALPKFVACPDRCGQELVGFWLDEKTRVFPRLAQVRENPERYAARVNMKPGPAFDAYVERNIHPNPDRISTPAPDTTK